MGRDVIIACDFPTRSDVMGFLDTFRETRKPFVKIGTDVKKNSPFRMTMVACLVNGDRGYFPSTDAFSQGGYLSRMRTP